MTEEKKRPYKYLTREHIKLIHDLLSEQFKAEEPLPPYSLVNDGNLDALIKIAQSDYFGREQYPTIESKAAIIFYTLNKKHLFQNGNKRMSVLCLNVFLIINGKQLETPATELTEKALWLAKTTHDHNFEEIKANLEKWISERAVDL